MRCQAQLRLLNLTSQSPLHISFDPPVKVPAHVYFFIMSVLQNKVTTDLPGPQSKASAEQLGHVFDARAVQFVADYEKSEGN